MYRTFNAFTVSQKLLYENVHASTGYPGYTGMQWHQKNTIGANYTDKDAAAAREICQGCALGSAHQYPRTSIISWPTNSTIQNNNPDDFIHHSIGHSGFVYAHRFSHQGRCPPSPSSDPNIQPTCTTCSSLILIGSQIVIER